MPFQYSVSHRTNKMAALSADAGSAAVFKFFTGPMPASCATADAGTLIATTGTTVTLNQASTAGVGLGVTVTFGGDFVLTNTSIASGQAVSVSSLSITASGA